MRLVGRCRVVRSPIQDPIVGGSLDFKTRHACGVQLHFCRRGQEQSVERHTSWDLGVAGWGHCRAWWHRPRGSRGVFRVYVRQRDEAPGDWGERTSPTGFDGGAPYVHYLRVIPILCLGLLATARLASHETRVGCRACRDRGRRARRFRGSIGSDSGARP